MRQLNILLCMVLFAVPAFADKKADNLLKNIYKNYESIQTIQADTDSTSIENNFIINKTEQKKKAARVKIKRPDKKKVIILNASSRQAMDIQPDISLNNSNKTLHPQCLFDIKNFLEHFNLSVLQKDERIKRGYEEIIAVPKGQEYDYPQVRILIKANKVERMRFYSLSGKRYYELKIVEYMKIQGVNIPKNITETFTTKKNTVINTIDYSNIILNEPIPDSEF